MSTSLKATAKLSSSKPPTERKTSRRIAGRPGRHRRPAECRPRGRSIRPRHVEIGHADDPPARRGRRRCRRVNCFIRVVPKNFAPDSADARSHCVAHQFRQPARRDHFDIVVNEGDQRRLNLLHRPVVHGGERERCRVVQHRDVWQERESERYCLSQQECCNCR